MTLTLHSLRRRKGYSLLRYDIVVFLILFSDLIVIYLIQAREIVVIFLRIKLLLVRLFFRLGLILIFNVLKQ